MSNKPLDIIDTLNVLLAKLDFIVDGLNLGDLSQEALQGASIILSEISDEIAEIENKLKSEFKIK